ncbi:MAG: sugar transferase [Mogibacterium sp.]|nr:sugar transferase [Mogibacterium sp.]
MLCLINIVITLAVNPYSGILRRPYYEDAAKLFLLTLYSFVFVAIFFYLMKIGAVYSRLTLVLTFFFYYIISLLALYVRKKLILSGKIKLSNVRVRQIFAIINYAGINELTGSINTSEIKEYSIAGYCFPCDECNEKSIDGVPVIKKKDVVEFVENNHIDDVFVSVDPRVFDAASYGALVANGVNVNIDIESLLGIQTDDQFISKVGSFNTLSVGPYAMDSNQAFYLIIKRALDIFFGIIGLLVLIPVTIGVKIAYLLTGDTAPIFYTHERIGQYGKPFRLIKFRSMRPDADKVLKELLKIDKYREEWARNQKFENDPRITRIGQFLRKTSIDEFPQFINMLKGDMSLVGPRPLVAGELEEHNGLTLYNKVRPGVTGWWACNGRSNISYKERLELEYYYVKNCSLYLDALCIFRSFFAVIHRDGAQ